MSIFSKYPVGVHAPDVSLRTAWLLILTAFLAALGIRSLLSFQIAGVPDFHFHGQPLPIYSPDAGLYGYYAKMILSGHAYPFVSEYMPGFLIAAVVKATGSSVDSVMFWLPGVLASLIVIPVVFFARAFHRTLAGFAAALITAAGANYYTRSYLGYMDTDTLNLFWPWLTVTFWAYALTRARLVYAAAAAFALLGFHLWYHSSAAVIVGLVGALALTLLFFFRKEPIVYRSLLLAAAVLIPLPPLATAALILGLSAVFALLQRKNTYGIRPCLILLGTGIAAAPFVLDLPAYLQRARDYLDKPETIAVATSHGIYRFTDVLGTVIEAAGAPVWHINALFGGLAPYMLIGTIGFVLFAFWHRAAFPALVLLLLGTLSFIAGIRFSMYAEPAFALGFVFAFSWLSKRFFPRGSIAVTAAATVGAFVLMLTNILRFNPHLAPFYFHHDEVKKLYTFAAHSDRKDLVLSWWDYGWPLWYYTGRSNTLIDNGRHGSDTFFVANELLSSSPAFVAGSAKYALKTKNAGHPEVMPQLLRQADVFDAFRRFSSPSFAPSLTHHAYYLLHRDMLPVLPTLAAVADRDPKTGRPTRQRQFYLSELREPFTGKSPIVYGDTFTLDLRNGRITGSDGAGTVVNTVVVSQHGKMTAAQRYDPRSPMFMILYNGTKALYMDGSVFSSFLIQALVLDRYDPARFEKVADTGIMKIFKVR